MTFTTSARDEPGEDTLRSLAQRVGLPIGAAAAITPLESDSVYAAVLAREFNLLVAENAFKPSEVWIGPTEYDFSVTDRLAAFAREQGMALRGHTLVWHNQTPRWLRSGLPTAETLRSLLRDYIHALVGRYRGQILQWDVVNEAIRDPESGGDEPGLREESPWHQALGPEYLSLAFLWAREADPEAQLYYNDYEIEALGPKSDAVYRLVNDLREQGAPVHGVGFQGHLEEGWRATDSHRRNLRRFADSGFDWQLTEVDVRLRLDGDPATAEQQEAQAAAYGDLLELCLSERRCQGCLFWGFTDAYSWIPGFRPGWGAALPLDENYRPKPAYYAVQNALRSASSR